LFTFCCRKPNDNNQLGNVYGSFFSNPLDSLTITRCHKEPNSIPLQPFFVTAGYRKFLS
jgi:hypothetical protein